MIPFDSELWRKFCHHVSIAEGGLSKDPNDSAVSCAPFSGAYHTNMGITFCTWKKNAPLIGITPTYENFVAMTKQQAENILYQFYKFATKNGAIKDNAIALSVTEAYWGSGGYAYKNLATALNNLGYKVTSALSLTTAMIQGANSVDAKKLFDAFWNARLEFLKSLPNANVYLNGWTSRVNAFKNIFRNYAGTIGIIFFGVLAYYFYRIYSKV